MEVTPNRPDYNSVIGIAREIAALTGNPLRWPEVTSEETGGPLSKVLDVRIEDPDLQYERQALYLRDHPSPQR